MPAPVDQRDPRSLQCSKYLSVFQHMGEVYMYHDLFGYILKMSPDILDFYFEFRDGALPDVVCGRYGGAFGDMTPESFVGIFIEFGCLVGPLDVETEAIWNTVAVRSKWSVWERRKDGSVVFYAGWGERPVQQVELSAKEARVFEDFDGETWLRDMVERHGPKRIARVVEKLAHHDVQAIKLARVPMSYFEVEGRQHLKPPYLTSTMPYAPYDPTTDPAPKPFEAEFSPEGYYRHEVADAEAQFDHQETTLSHLFRHPHPALRGQTYGSALVAGLEAKGLLEGETLRVLEIGGGLGFVAKAVVEALQARDKTVTYDILELSPALAKAQRERTAGLPVTIHEGDVLTDPWPADAYDVIVANEMIGDLPAVQLTREQLGLDVDEEMDEEAYDALFAERLAALGEVGAYLDKYKIPVGDSPPEFYLNLGAFKLAEHIAARLAPGGFAILTEFGEMGRYPVLSTQLDHPELSIHFGHLAFVGRELGLDYDFVYVMDLIDMDRDAEGLATTRSYFKALKALLAEHEVELEKIGYTRTMFEALIAGKLAPDRFGELHFELIENRLMGLVPHEFKALIFKRKAD